MTNSTSQSRQEPEIIELSGKKFLALSALVALGVLFFFRNAPIAPGWIAAEVFSTVIALFILGSIKYRLDKNALTYGAGLIISASFLTGWWQESHLRQAIHMGDKTEVLHFVHHHFLTLHGLDKLIHADTMLFILGLTFFVAVIAQTRLLETISFRVLEMNRGKLVQTVAILAAIVALASGVLDGVSMIGLMIRTMVILLFLARVKDENVIFAVMISTVVTTVCGMYLAYGEPPNLIMKANLHPYLDNKFFLQYCFPVAFACYWVVFFNLRKRLAGRHVDTAALDILDRHTDDVRFLQASKHGEVFSSVEFIEEHAGLSENQVSAISKRLHEGEPLGLALRKENVEPGKRQEILGHFIHETIAAPLDEHYKNVLEDHAETKASFDKVKSALAAAAKERRFSQKIGIISFLPFIGLLIAHAINHDIPLFWASVVGFLVAVVGIWNLPKMRKLAIKEAAHEYSEYLFLLPLFFSITLLQKTGFFTLIADALVQGVEKFGEANMAFGQFIGAAFLSAMLDNNVVADFAGRALHGLSVSVIHIFAMAQIAGYAAGGCWTHIGSAQSVVAYAFIHKEVDPHFTPIRWIKAMTPVILEIFVVMSIIIYTMALVLHWG